MVGIFDRPLSDAIAITTQKGAVAGDKIIGRTAETSNVSREEIAN